MSIKEDKFSFLCTIYICLLLTKPTLENDNEILNYYLILIESNTMTENTCLIYLQQGNKLYGTWINYKNCVRFFPLVKMTKIAEDRVYLLNGIFSNEFSKDGEGWIQCT